MVIKTKTKNKGRKPDATIPPNSLKTIRESLGLTPTDLSRECTKHGMPVSVRTIQDIEKGKIMGKPETRQKIVHVLNTVPHRKKDYSYEDVFPQKRVV